MASENVVTVDAENFDRTVLSSERPVLVDFWATWCGPCKQIAPVLDELADELSEKVTIAKLDVDQSRDLAMQYQVLGVPTLILFKGGEIADRTQGAVPKGALKELIEKHV